MNITFDELDKKMGIYEKELSNEKAILYSKSEGLSEKIFAIERYEGKTQAKTEYLDKIIMKYEKGVTEEVVNVMTLEAKEKHVYENANKYKIDTTQLTQLNGEIKEAYEEIRPFIPPTQNPILELETLTKQHKEQKNSTAPSSTTNTPAFKSHIEENKKNEKTENIEMKENKKTDNQHQTPKTKGPSN